MMLKASHHCSLCLEWRLSSVWVHFT